MRVCATYACVLMAALASSSVSADATRLQGTVVWSGETRIRGETVVPPGARLNVAPGAHVVFEGNGRLNCQGAFEAHDAVFEATSPIEGQARLLFHASKSVPVTFESCTLRDLVTVKRRYHDAFLTVIYARFRMVDCVIENTSTIEIMHTTATVLTGNTVVDNVHRGVMLIASDRARIQRNHFDGCAVNRPMLILLTSSDCQIAENRFFGRNRSIGLTIGGGSADNRVLANSLFSCLEGIEIAGKNNHGNLLLGNLVRRPLNAGVRVRQCGSRTVIRNCVVWGSGGAGIEYADCAGLSVHNCVFAKGKRALRQRENAADIIATYDCFWSNADEPPREVTAERDGNVSRAPLFVDPEQGNYRLQSKAFGYPENSPLLNAGTPPGTNIGLYPLNR